MLHIIQKSNDFLNVTTIVPEFRLAEGQDEDIPTTFSNSLDFIGM